MLRVFVFAILSVAPGVSVASDDRCMLADEMDAALVDWYDERAVAETEDGGTVLWTNDSTGSWTLVAYDTEGLACVLGSGEALPENQSPTELMVKLAF